MIDLRSDTVTLPTPEMLAAMAAAELGDDVLDGDPTTRRLEARAAELMGMEAALLVPSGTMANLLASQLHTRPGDEVIVEASQHVYQFENNGLAAVSGCLAVPVEGVRGHLTAAVLEAAVGKLVPRGQGPSLVWLENTANLAGGTVQRPEETAAVVAFAKARGWHVHLDGARIFDAAVALGVPAAQLAAGCDTVMFCLSKGLSCPAGSLLCGSRETIARAHELRRRFGGAMRQSGVLAAAGLVALATGMARLADDHRLARLLAAKLAAAPAIQVDQTAVETNMVWFQHGDLDWPARCAAAGVRFVSLGDGRCRAVCHRGIDQDAVETAATTMIATLKQG